MNLKPLAAALLLAPLASLAQAEVTFTPFASYHWFDGDTLNATKQAAPNTRPDIEDELGYALALGYRFTPALGLEVNYGRTESDADVLPSVTVRNSRLSLDGYYAFNTESAFSPYVLLGVGQTRIKTALTAGVEDTLAEAGIGAFYRFNQNVALRAELRNVHNIDETLNDQLALVGLEFSPGGAAAKADEPAQQPEQAQEEAPVEQLAAAPADADADGVADDQDQCPDTTAGVTVDANGCPLDADKDGVTDSQDQCPNTVAGAKVDAKGCEIDTDKDGVADSADKCPDTKAGAAVDATGCYQMLQQEVGIALNVTFASGKADIQGDASAEIQKVADFMTQYPNVNVTIEGHTDSRGNAKLNKNLSQKRADAVKAEIVKLGVDAARLASVGYGSAQPVADNATEEGRAQNRRVVATAKAQTQTIKMKKK